MIMSMQIAQVGAKAPSMLRRSPKPDKVPGLHYAEMTTCAPLGGGLLPKPSFGRIGLFAAWDDDAAYERFAEEDELGRRMSEGYQVRLEPLRASGRWHELDGLMPTPPRRVADDEPVAVLTLGRLRLANAGRFLRANKPAANQAVDDPAMLASTGLARPPHLLATFSLWRTAAEMRDYAYGDAAGAHADVIRAHREKPFHHESLFARFRPYAPRGEWDGRDPLADVTLPGASTPEPVGTSG